jgi:pyruvate/2-oxoglutarate dehydrogenase complex dihydrolipoamide acyltransferase (E2) component
MGNLRDQLKKAKILSEAEARRLAHQERVERKEKSREEVEQEQRTRQQDLQALQTQERQRTAQQQAQFEADRKAREEQAAVRAILATETRKAGPGLAKWYFEAADGSLPWLELSPRDAQEVRAGMICVVRTGPPGTHDYRLLGTELTRRVARLMPEVVAFAPRGVL